MKNKNLNKRKCVNWIAKHLTSRNEKSQKRDELWKVWVHANVTKVSTKVKNNPHDAIYWTYQADVK